MLLLLLPLLTPHKCSTLLQAQGIQKTTHQPLLLG